MHQSPGMQQAACDEHEMDAALVKALLDLANTLHLLAACYNRRVACSVRIASRNDLCLLLLTAHAGLRQYISQP